MTLSGIAPLLVTGGIVSSKSEWLRLILQCGVQLNEEKLSEADLERELRYGDVVRIGKKKFIRLIE